MKNKRYNSVNDVWSSDMEKELGYNKASEWDEFEDELKLIESQMERMED